MDAKYKKDVEEYVDDEASPERQARMEDTINAFPSLKEYADKIEWQKDMLKKWWEASKNNHH